MIDKRVYEGAEFKKLAYVRKQRPDAYACLVEATRNLNTLEDL